MTNEEAINVLRNTAWLGTENDRERVEKAVELAVEALENEIPHTCNYSSAQPERKKGEWIKKNFQKGKRQRIYRLHAILVLS